MAPGLSPGRALVPGLSGSQRKDGSALTADGGFGTSEELGDNCAPMELYVDARHPKGTICIAQFSAGASDNSENVYGTHPCRADSDCADIVIAGEKIRCDQSNDQCDDVSQ